MRPGSGPEIIAGMEILRRATGYDAQAVADLWLRSFDAALPTVRRSHTDDEVRSWFADVVVPRCQTWVAVTPDGRPVGVMALDGPDLDQLYLCPDHRGRGLGDRFADLAKERRPDGLDLWCFQVNGPALRFYARHGFVEVERTDGARNEEREPDVHLRWRP